jgi:hypothetical protein
MESWSMKFRVCAKMHSRPASPTFDTACGQHVHRVFRARTVRAVPPDGFTHEVNGRDLRGSICRSLSGSPRRSIEQVVTERIDRLGGGRANDNV